MPSYLAKGLEFDCVILFNANEENYNTAKTEKFKFKVIEKTESLRK